MTKSQRAVSKATLEEEQKVIRKLNEIFTDAQKECDKKIEQLMNRKDIDNIQSIVYQANYQKAIKKQVDSALENLHGNEYKTISDYLTKCYENGYIGTMYDLANQGIPMVVPLDQKAMIRAIELDSKLSESLYKHLGINVEDLKKSISKEISRGIANAESWQDTAKRISNNMIGDMNVEKGAYSYALRIARTEGHRIQVQSSLDALYTAKDNGADIVKQWDSSLDGDTRYTHRLLHNQIRELDEPFEVLGMEVEAPGMFGTPSEDCNCRCEVLQRAKWALDDTELQFLHEQADYFGLDRKQEFSQYKEKYLKINN